MKQIIIGGWNDPLNNAGNEWNAVQGGNSWSNNVSYRYQVIPTGGTLSRLSVELSGVPGTNPYRIGLYLNGALTALTVDIDPAGTTNINLVNSVAVVAGDLVCIQSSRPAGNPDNTPTARWSIMFTGTNPRESIIMANVYTLSLVDTQHAGLTQMAGLSTTEFIVLQVIPTGGTLSKLYVDMHADPGVAPNEGFRFRLRVNLADSNDGAGNPLSVDIYADNRTGNDTAHTIPVVAGDLVCIQSSPLNAPTVGAVTRWGLVFTATIDGESLILGNTGDPVSSADNEFFYLNAGWLLALWSVNEYFNGGQAPSGNMILRKFYVKLTVAPGGAGQSYNFTVRGGGGNTSITCEIAAAATTANDTVHTYTVASYDDLALAKVPNNNPAAARVGWGIVGYIATGSTAPKSSVASRMLSSNLI
jgi:hypothetical protein